MNRREFFRRAALLAAGAVAADQLELLERLAHRKVWTGWQEPVRLSNHVYVLKSYSLGFYVTAEMINDELKRAEEPIAKALRRATVELNQDYYSKVEALLYARS